VISPHQCAAQLPQPNKRAGCRVYLFRRAA
jgi:hypothetical protein